MMNILKYIAVDDDTLDLLAVSTHAYAFAQLVCCGTYNSVNDALEAVKVH